MDCDCAITDEIIESYNGEKEMLISILQDMQSKYNYLPREAMERVSARLDIPLGQVFGVATFYKAFSLTPRGRHQLSLCLGTACHVRGSSLLAGHIERTLGLKAGETSPDLEYTFETVGCLGACALGPILVVDGEYHGHMTITEATKLLKNLGKKVETDQKD
jgi:NADH-quinone oxidoreductase subunit E